MTKQLPITKEEIEGEISKIIDVVFVCSENLTIKPEYYEEKISLLIDIIRELTGDKP
jgi:hypothetical protein